MTTEADRVRAFVAVELSAPTRDDLAAKGNGSIFSDVKEARLAYDSGSVDLHASAKIRIYETVVDDDGNQQQKSTIYDTTVGRAILSEILPSALPFSAINRVMKKKAISEVRVIARRV